GPARARRSGRARPARAERARGCIRRSHRRSRPPPSASVCLTCAPAVQPLLHSGAMSETPMAAAGGTLLLVDDEAANLDSLERIFSREGYRTLRAESGAAALDLLRTEPVDVVLTDLMM